MCGFAGVIAWDERYRVSRETLARMSAAIAHRGPDGEGFHINHEEAITPDRPQVALAFRRLAILDPDPRSNQPFTDGRHWLVFNGEIYNFRELRKELTAASPDYQWRTTGDTEVLLRAYAVWGEKCVEHLNGMFAFAVWDEVEKSLFLARDRMGQKPLFFSATTIGSAIAFASELQALTMLPWIGTGIEDVHLRSYLRRGYVGPGGSTFFESIRTISPGSWLRRSQTSHRGRAYFRVNSIDASPVRTDSPETSTRKLLTQAVERQLVSDVPIGCFLSGGMDSSVIAAVMQAATVGGRIHTFSIGFEDPRYNEESYAKAVAAHIGSTHRSFVVRPDAANDLPKLAAAFGEPFGDSSALPTHYISREVKKYVKVALSGDGGDELFGGYDRYRAMQLAEGFRFPKTLQLAAAFLPEQHPKSMGARIRRFAASIEQSPSDRYTGYMRIFNDGLIRELTGSHKTAHRWRDHHVFLFKQLSKTRDSVQAALALDRFTYLPDDLLTKVDRCSMLHGLEVRSPFMDHELVQFAAGLTTDQLLKGGPKRMLREAFADDLPAWVFKRKKMGFAVPIGDWFRGELRPMLRDTLFSTGAFGRSHFNMKVVERLVEEHETQRVDHSQRLYALLMLELWWNTVRA
jgi:asparagine synthase (glutamine-hydrolysing)